MSYAIGVALFNYVDLAQAGSHGRSIVTTAIGPEDRPP